jgi:hypothetical protein
VAQLMHLGSAQGALAAHRVPITKRELNMNATKPSCRTCLHSIGTSSGGLFCMKTGAGLIHSATTRSTSQNLEHDARLIQIAVTCPAYFAEVVR